MKKFIEEILQPAIKTGFPTNCYIGTVQRLRIAWATGTFWNTLETKKKQDTFQLIKIWMYDYILNVYRKSEKYNKTTAKINELMLTEDADTIIKKVEKMLK